MENPNQGVMVDTPEQGQVQTEPVDITLPSGEEVTVVVPVGMSDQEIKFQLIDQGEKGFKPDGSAVDRFMYGAKLGQQENITGNLEYYAKSHLPFLINEFVWTPETGFYTVSPTEKYGEDFNDLSPKDRRDRMKTVDGEALRKEYEGIHPQNLGFAGGVGKVTSAIIDPVAIVPVGRAAQGIKSAVEVARTSAKVGAGWGAAYGGSEVLADKGIPTTVSEAIEAVPKVVIPAVVGAAGGLVLGEVAYKIGQGLSRRRAAKALNTPEKAQKFAQERYYPAIWNEQLKGKTAAEATQTVRDHFKLGLDDEWRMRQSVVEADAGWAVRQETGVNRQGTALYSPAMNKMDAAKRLGDAKATRWGDPILLGSRQQFVDDVARPIIGTVKDISPRIGQALLDMEGRILSKTHEYHQVFHPFMSGVSKLRKVARTKDFNRFASALFNSRSNEARDMWLRHGLDMKDFDAMKGGLRQLGKELDDTGIDYHHFEDYFPRIVNDYQGFRAQAGRSPELKGLEKVLQDAALKKKSPLTDAEQTDIINKWMAIGEGKGVKKDIKSLKERRVHEVTDDILPFYHDPATSLEFHLREMISKIERHKFYGKGNAVVKDSVENVTKSIGELMRREGVTGDDAVRLAAVLESRFGKGEQTGRQTLNALRQVTGGVTLGNPISALRQLGDIPSVMRTQGVANTLASMIKRQDPDVNPDSFGYMLEMAQEMDTKGVSKKVRAASQWLYKAGGFRSMDRYTKGVAMKSALRNAQKSAQSDKGKMKLINKYSDVYQPEELFQLIDDLEAGRITDLVKSHVNAEIMKIQPISRSQMPKAYLDHPNGRMLYQFRTWGINQIELVRREIWRGLKSPDPVVRREAAGAGLLYLAGVGVTNVGITELQKTLTGRDTKSVNELGSDVVWQALANFGFDRYGIEKYAESGNAEEYLNSFLPPSISIPATIGAKTFKAALGEQPVDEGLKDVLKETGFGRLINFWFLDGAEEWNAKQEKRTKQERKASNSNPYSR